MDGLMGWVCRSVMTIGLRRASPKVMAFFITVSPGPSMIPSIVGALKMNERML